MNEFTYLLLQTILATPTAHTLFNVSANQRSISSYGLWIRFANNKLFNQSPISVFIFLFFHRLSFHFNFEISAFHVLVHAKHYATHYDELFKCVLLYFFFRAFNFLKIYHRCDTKPIKIIYDLWNVQPLKCKLSDWIDSAARDWNLTIFWLTHITYKRFSHNIMSRL